jgi:diaminobutyrate-2-oxoglutarate transaminase
MIRYEYIRSLESNARTYAETFKTVFESGSGFRIRDAGGREILDCLGCAGALPLGHNHPEVTREIVRFVQSGQLQQTLDLSTPAKYEFMQELVATLPGSWARDIKIQFCSPSGSDAVEAALKLVRFATQRQVIIAFHGAYHGMTAGSLAAMGSTIAKAGFISGVSGVHFAPFPHRFRCPFGSDGSDTDRLCLNYLRTILTDPESGITRPAGILVEAVQGEGGCIPASVQWLNGLAALAREHDVPLILDEVQTGFGRTGSMFAFEAAGISPDVVVLSKALGGGYPLAAILYKRRLDKWCRGMHAGTFRGNQIAMVAGKTTMRVIREEQLVARAEELGTLLASGLERLSATFDEIGDVRGRGLMIGVEVVVRNVDGSPGRPDGARAAKIKQAAFEEGLLLENGGRQGAVLRFLPPLNITTEDVVEVLARFERALVRTQRELKGLYVSEGRRAALL